MKTVCSEHLADIFDPLINTYVCLSEFNYAVFLCQQPESLLI